MQLIGAYLIFMFGVVALGLGIILLGTIAITVGMGVYEGRAWLRLVRSHARKPSSLPAARR